MRASAATPLIAVKAASVTLGPRLVLHNVDLTIDDGEVVTLIGPNGAGKTTLVRMILGLVAPSAGSVQRRAGLTVGYLPQRFQVDPVLPLPVRRLMTLTGRHPEAAIIAALAETGVGHLPDAPVHSLSGGELQRVLLARALLRRPQILVLDEPVQGVDYAGEASLYALIGRIRQTYGCAVLMVSHDLHVVMAATDRVVCLNAHVCCEGAPHTVACHPEYLKIFGPQTAEAFAVYTHHHDHRHALDGCLVAEAPPAVVAPKGQG